MESRTITRWDVHRYAREAYDAGARYIGGCCGFESYHIRAIAEEVDKISCTVSQELRNFYENHNCSLRLIRFPVAFKKRKSDENFKNLSIFQIKIT